MIVRKLLVGVTGVMLLARVASACTDENSSDRSSQMTGSTTSTVPADPTFAACTHFATLWVEFAQIYNGAHGFGDTTPDPHGLRAGEAADAAFAAAAQGSPVAQRLGAKAKGQFEGSIPGDPWASISQFFDLCGHSHPVVECEDNTACSVGELDRA